MAVVLLGTVSSYDEEKGLGMLRQDDGTEYLFHCTAIADGTRRIEPATGVAFCLVAAQGGAFEAASLQKLG